MDIERALHNEHSQRQTLKITRWIGDDPERLRYFMNVFLEGDPVIVQRGAWVIGKLADVHPDRLVPYLRKLIAKMDEPSVHDAVKRNILRLLQTIEIPSRLVGVVVTYCFDLLSSPDESIAVKVYAMTVIARFCTKQPDLERELRLVVSMQLPMAGAAFRARARKILKLKDSAATEGPSRF